MLGLARHSRAVAGRGRGRARHHAGAARGLRPLGHRIGYGAGHYDYTFAHLRKAKPVIGIGLAFAAQEIKAVPALSHDVALDYVLTEKRAFDFRSG